MNPTSIPAYCKSTMPWPSRTSNLLLSTPRSSITMPPSVRTPSTSSNKSLILRTLWRRGAGIAFTEKSYKTRFDQIVEMDNTQRRSSPVFQNKQRGYRVLFHDGDRFGRQSYRRDGFRVARHQISRFQIEDIAMALKGPPQISVGDDADKFSPRIDDAGHSQSL